MLPFVSGGNDRVFSTNHIGLKFSWNKPTESFFPVPKCQIVFRSQISASPCYFHRRHRGTWIDIWVVLPHPPVTSRSGVVDRASRSRLGNTYRFGNKSMGRIRTSVGCSLIETIRNGYRPNHEPKSGPDFGWFRLVSLGSQTLSPTGNVMWMCCRWCLILPRSDALASLPEDIRCGGWLWCHQEVAWTGLVQSRFWVRGMVWRLLGWQIKPQNCLSQLLSDRTFQWIMVSQSARRRNCLLQDLVLAPVLFKLYIFDVSKATSRLCQWHGNWS